MTDYHIPALLNESIEALNIKPDGLYVDVTFGGGGHSSAILKRITTGKLIAFDQDEEAMQNLPDSPNFYFAHQNFKFLKHFLRYLSIDRVDGILADLGVSSHHFDSAERGFSTRFDGPLDMRMNPSATRDAASILNEMDAQSLFRIFKLYGEIDHARKLVTAIEQARSAATLQSIAQFKQAIKSCIPAHQENKFLAKVFQALRIEVNQELEALNELLSQSVDVLKPGGRLVVITYHSLEDRIVKNFMKSGNSEGKQEKDFYGNVKSPFTQLNRKVITASESEIEENSRARSAKLRIGERAHE